MASDRAVKRVAGPSKGARPTKVHPRSTLDPSPSSKDDQPSFRQRPEMLPEREDELGNDASRARPQSGKSGPRKKRNQDTVQSPPPVQEPAFGLDVEPLATGGVSLLGRGNGTEQVPYYTAEEMDIFDGESADLDSAEQPPGVDGGDLEEEDDYVDVEQEELNEALGSDVDDSDFRADDESSEDDLDAPLDDLASDEKDLAVVAEESASEYRMDDDDAALPRGGRRPSPRASKKRKRTSGGKGKGGKLHSSKARKASNSQRKKASAGKKGREPWTRDMLTDIDIGETNPSPAVEVDLFRVNAFRADMKYVIRARYNAACVDPLPEDGPIASSTASLLRRLGVDGVWDLVDRYVRKDVQSTYGTPYPTVDELCRLPGPTDAELSHMGVYASFGDALEAPSDGFRYGGSGTAQSTESKRGVGLGARWYEYQKLKVRANKIGRVPDKVNGHLARALRPGVKWHLRPVALVPLDMSPATALLLEGLFCDLGQSVSRNSPDPSKRSYRFHTAEMADASRRAVPQHRQNPSWLALNFCSPFKQGVRDGAKVGVHAQLLKQNGLCACCLSVPTDMERVGFHNIRPIPNGHVICQACVAAWYRLTAKPRSRAETQQWVAQRRAGISMVAQHGLAQTSKPIVEKYDLYLKQDRKCLCCAADLSDFGAKAYPDSTSPTNNSLLRVQQSDEFPAKGTMSVVCIECLRNWPFYKQKHNGDPDDAAVQAYCDSRKGWLTANGKRDKKSLAAENQGHVCPLCQLYLPHLTGAKGKDAKNTWVFCNSNSDEQQLAQACNVQPDDVVCKSCKDAYVAYVGGVRKREGKPQTPGEWVGSRRTKMAKKAANAK